ncbi:hypothetical protein GGE24_005157 [Bradyrhizobium centrosematis]|nr:hypothetical protein [Bradyrhizobium centrosematis]MCS3775818.1 hypothetical protein [Bradyrhizobium centrosematis]
MSKAGLGEISPDQRNTLDSPQGEPFDARRHGDEEMARVLKTVPLRMASDPSNGIIAYWSHNAVHD